MKYAYRLSPCPSYAVADTECWLAELAEEGLMLSENGFFGGLGVFEKAEPRPGVRYRLEAAPKSTSLFSDSGGLPEREQKDMMADEGWEYVCNRGDFYIYRSTRPDAAEPNTDPAVQALTLSAVVKRRRSSLFTAVFYMIFYPLLIIKGSVINLMVTTGSHYILLFMLLLLWGTFSSLKEYLFLRSMEKRLKRGLPLPQGSVNAKRAARHRVGGAIYILLVLLLISMTVPRVTHKYAAAKREVPLDQYTGELPFAELGGLIGGEFKADRDAMKLGYNTVGEWSDLLAPRCISFFQSGTVGREDGENISAILKVTYYEMRSPLTASLLARELYRNDRLEMRGDFFYPVDFDPPEGDYSAVYNHIHQQTLILQKGNIVIQAYLVPLGPKEIPFEQWAAAMAESIS